MDAIHNCFCIAFLLDSKPQKTLALMFWAYYMTLCCKFDRYSCGTKKMKFLINLFSGRLVCSCNNIKKYQYYSHLFSHFCFLFFSFSLFVVLIFVIWHLECFEFGLINFDNRFWHRTYLFNYLLIATWFSCDDHNVIA